MALRATGHVQNTFEWWAEHRKLLMAKTLKDYSFRVKHAERWMIENKKTPLAAATPRQVLAYFDSCKPTPWTRKNARAALVCYFQYLEDTGARRGNPADRLPRWKQPKRPPRPLPERLIHPFIRACADYSPMFECLCLLYLNTGLRLEELRTLKWRNVQDGWAYITQKGGDQRAVGLNTICVKALERWREHCFSRELVFPSPRNIGQPISAHWIWWKFHEIGEKVGIEGCRPHRLRHTFGSTLYEKTGDIEVVSEALGHRDIENTRIYARARPQQVRQAIEQLHFDI